MAGLYDDTPGLSDGTGLWRGRLGLFSGASGLINGSGGAYIDLYFSRGAYSVAGSGYTTLTSIPGFTFTGASLRMGYDATGKLVYGPNNLALQSQTFDNASWVKSGCTVSANATTAPDGSLTADMLVEDTGSGSHQITQANTENAAGAVISVYAKPNGRSWVGVSITDAGGSNRITYFNISAGVVGVIGTGVTAAITSAGNGWYRCSVALPSTFNGTYTHRIYLCSADNVTAYTGDGVSGAYVWGYQAEAVTYQTTPSTYYPTTTAAYFGPRLVYDPVTLASQGILVEEARTNSCLQSSTFSTTWSAVVSNVTANSTTAPDGTLTADTLVPTAVLQQHRLDQTTTITAAAHNASVYAKAAGYGFLWMRLGTLAGVFNLSTGAITSLSGGATGVATDVGNGWWRCALQGTTAGSDVYRLAATPTASTADYTGDGTSGIYLWGAQIELGVGASSPIPTTTAAVTRAADVPDVTGLSVASESTVVIEWSRYPFSVATFPRPFSLTDGTSNNLKATFGSGANVWSQATIGGAVQGDVLAGTGQTADTAYKMATRWAVGSRRSAINGTLGTLGTADIASAVLTRLSIGCSVTGAAQLNGTISRIRVFNTALTDAQLQNLTQSLLLQEDDFSILQEDNSYIWLE